MSYLTLKELLTAVPDAKSMISRRLFKESSSINPSMVATPLIHPQTHTAQAET